MSLELLNKSIKFSNKLVFLNSTLYSNGLHQSLLAFIDVTIKSPSVKYSGKLKVSLSPTSMSFVPLYFIFI